MIADLGAGTRPALYDLCAKYRSGVLVCYIKKPWWEIPVTANIVPSQRIVPMGGDKKSATINDSGFGCRCKHLLELLTGLEPVTSSLPRNKEIP